MINYNRYCLVVIILQYHNRLHVFMSYIHKRRSNLKHIFFPVHCASSRRARSEVWERLTLYTKIYTVKTDGVQYIQCITGNMAHYVCDTNVLQAVALPPVYNLTRCASQLLQGLLTDISTMRFPRYFTTFNIYLKRQHFWIQ
jgi:hypothetical protein